ncbi:MAG: PTS glucose transporter subunit IIA [Tissierellia bacterium]|nr:PTS glucose transporter subunit IIA [Tissierellia bacterium]
MFNLFKKKEINDVEVKLPLDGKILPIEEVPDQVFSQKMVGDGFAVEPRDGKVYAPVDGEIVLRPDELHAIGIRAKNGAEILIHFGMDTVELKGEGFTSSVNVGDQVKEGDLLLTVDLDLIKEKVPSTITPVIVSNPDDYQWDAINNNAQLHETVMTVVKK